MFRGKVVGIYVASTGNEPMDARREARLVEGVGIEGDRYAAGTGTYSGAGRAGRQVTLIEHEAVEAAAREGDIELADHDTRRNLVTQGVPLNHLVGREFRVGDVVLRGLRLAEPCAYLEGLLDREGVRQALIHRGGLRADIVTGGTITTGNDIVALT